MEASSRNYLIGMDMGTTNIKAIIMDDEANVLARANRGSTSGK